MLIYTYVRGKIGMRNSLFLFSLVISLSGCVKNSPTPSPPQFSLSEKIAEKVSPESIRKAKDLICNSTTKHQHCSIYYDQESRKLEIELKPKEVMLVSGKEETDQVLKRVTRSIFSTLEENLNIEPERVNIKIQIISPQADNISGLPCWGVISGFPLRIRYDIGCSKGSVVFGGDYIDRSTTAEKFAHFVEKLISLRAEKEERQCKEGAKDYCLNGAEVKKVKHLLEDFCKNCLNNKYEKYNFRSSCTLQNFGNSDISKNGVPTIAVQANGLLTRRKGEGKYSKFYTPGKSHDLFNITFENIAPTPKRKNGYTAVLKLHYNGSVPLSAEGSKKAKSIKAGTEKNAPKAKNIDIEDIEHEMTELVKNHGKGRACR